MDRIINTKTEQQSIYEIYRACRLCGAGAGYKMPIIQNVVDLDTSGIELTQKIRDCVQIEVHPDDKMPPLICELCVDKVNDFYEFVELCQRTNKRTRMRLGLPAQTSARVAGPSSDASSNSGDCILGVTEPVYQNDDSDEPLAPVTRRAKQNEAKPKSVTVKKENSKPTKTVISSKLKRPPTPPRATRNSKSSSEDTMSLSSLKQQSKKSSNKTASPPQPKSILKKEKDKEKREESPVPTRSKRPREPPKPEVPQKKVKLAVSPKATPKAKPAPRAPSPPPSHPCRICGKPNSTGQALGNHLRSHTVQFTSAKLACNPCQKWFATPEEAQSHHKWHRVKRKPYHCKRCGLKRDSLAQYTGHIENGECIPWEEVPDKQCPECWKMFPTDNWLQQHNCGGPDARPGGKCSKCRRVYALLKNLKKHEATCTHKKKDKVIVDPEVQARIKPAQVRIARCDALLTRVKQEHYDVSDVAQNFGLDRRCVYPYISSYAQSELPRDSMVKIKTELDDYEEEDFVHWDSDSESDDEASRRVDSLSTLTLKKIFSKKCLGKVPRKRRRVKFEKNVFDSLQANEFENTISRDINNIIDNLGNDDDSWDKNNDDNQNGSDEESLLTNFVPFDDLMASNNDEKVKDSNDTDDSQSILDASDDKVSDKTRLSNTDQDTSLDKDVSAKEKKESRDSVEESNKNCEQDISRISRDENNDETNKVGDSNAEKNDDIDTRTAIRNENYYRNEKDSSENRRIDSKEEDYIENSEENKIDNDSKQESTNNDNLKENSEIDTKMDCTEDISANASSENNDISKNNETVNIAKENTSVDDKEIVPNSDTANSNYDTENINCETTNNEFETKTENKDTETLDNVSEKTNDVSSVKKVNGEVEEKSEKLSFGDMNDISDTEVDDKKLMDALDEHIGDNDSRSESVNGDTKNNEKHNDFRVLNEQNGAKNDVSNACEDTTHTNNVTESNNYENTIHNLIFGNNDTFTQNNDKITVNNDSSNNDVVSDSNDRNAESENRVNDCETDKISLEDLLPPKSDAKSMDLDSISDDDFDFDAC
ncbi:hypothetical protein ABMA27_012220 [Loxostege sticticalis]|uniref:Uncharacterized protein n=1 Tax=Loxostege sticticalis TaxID=481309 RepID=A0ABR3H0I4_LOXSC